MWVSKFQYLTKMNRCFINLPSTGLWSALKGPSFKNADHEILVEIFTGHVIVLRCLKNNYMKILTFKRKHTHTSPTCFYLLVASWCLSCTHVFLVNECFIHPGSLFPSTSSLSLVLFLGHPVCFFNQPGLFNDDLLKSTPWKVSRWRITGLHLQSYHLLADFLTNCTPRNLT